jgi:subtilisin-like proprotein convertase family protein
MKKRFLIVALVMAFVVVFTAAVMAEQTVRVGGVQAIADAVVVSGGGDCATFTAAPGSIPDNNPAGICADIPVSGLYGNTTFVSVTVGATHSWVGDITYRLADPAASQLYIMARPGVAGPAGTGFGSTSDLSSAYPLDFYDAAATDAEQVGAGNPAVVCQTNGICDFNPGPDGQTGLADFSGFTGAVNGTWQFCAFDGAGGDTGSVAAVNLNVCGEPAPLPSIAVTKTVGLDANVCATTTTISAPYNSDVTYCYTMVNTGNVTVTTHTVVDDKLGTLLNNFPFVVGPGNGAYFTVTTTITDSVTNVVTWTAFVDAQTSTAGSASATVTGEPTDVALTTFGGNTSTMLVPMMAVAVLVGLGVLFAIRRRQEA